MPASAVPTEETSPPREPTEDDLRATIEEAFASFDASPSASEAAEPSAEATPEETPPAGEPSAPDTPADPDAPLLPGSDEPSAPPEPPPTAPDTPPTPPDPELGASEPLPEGFDASKAPESWRPATRELWPDLPDSVQAEIHRRERAISKGFSQLGEARRFHETLTRVLEPHQQQIAIEAGGDPVQAISGLLNVAATLQSGGPAQKAQQVAALIGHYGVDLHQLDAILAAQVSGDPPPSPAALDPALDARLKPIEQFASTLQSRLEQAERQRAEKTQTEIEQFSATHDFFEDVRDDMADLMTLAAQRGRNMTLEEAYETACNMNPEVRSVLSQRQQADVQRQQQHRVAEKVHAADSLPTSGSGSSPGLPSERPSDGTLRGDLLRAIDQVEQRRRG